MRKPPHIRKRAFHWQLEVWEFVKIAVIMGIYFYVWTLVQ